MYNIQKAVSRLNYAPKLKEVKVTDIKKGLGVFTPKPDKPVSFAALAETLKKAGYTLASADVTAIGTLSRAGETASLIIPASGQRFVLDVPTIDKMLGDIPSGSTVEISGDWKTRRTGAADSEVVMLRTVKAVSKRAAPKATHSLEPRSDLEARLIAANFQPRASSFSPFTDIAEFRPLPAAPIRVTSPGLTVYKGGAVTPRLYFAAQHLGSLDVDRQIFDLSVSYTPSPRLQLEVEVPVARTSFDDGLRSGSGTGLGNITIWSKYRFFRKVKTYGDRQASARFGLELPTGKKDAPPLAKVNAPAFVRQQLTPISGSWSPHFDLSFSQAGGRIIFGGNAEAILRSERDGFRMGHEVRVNTDMEYVLLPRDYDVPGGELFVILETTFIHRGTGRLASAKVSGSNSTEYYFAPGLQYAAATQFVVEGSYQFPLVRNTGPLVLRTDRNILLGVRYLF